MRFVGVDLHKQSISLCVMSQAASGRKVVDRKRFACEDEASIAAYFASLGSHQVVVEATASYEWFVQLVEPTADRVVLAHPKKLRIIAESTKKTDKLDAQVLAEMLALDMIPEAWRPTPRVREHRVLVRLRRRTSRRITRGEELAASRLGRLQRRHSRAVHPARPQVLGEDQAVDRHPVSGRPVVRGTGRVHRSAQAD